MNMDHQQEGSASAIDILQDAQSPHSLHTPPPKLPQHDADANNIDLSQLSARESANHLFLNSEILAPMVRASTTPLRTLALSHGATLTYTEELVDRSITPTERILNTQLGTIDYRVPFHTYSKKVQRRMLSDKDNPDSKNGAVLLRIDPLVEHNKLIYQIGTGESSLAVKAAEKVIGDFVGVDVNMGCPKKFSVSGGMGSALLGDTKRACDIISTLRRNLGNKPVSAKIRLLDESDPRPTLDFVRALIQAGANAITIHGRIAGDEAHVNARWETLVEVVQQLKQTESVPIIVNGDLYTRADIHEMKRRTGCDGVMLARPALYNVSLFNRGSTKEEKKEEEAKDEQQLQQQQASATANNDSNMSISQFQTNNHLGYYGYNSPLLTSRQRIVQEYLTHCVRYRCHSKNAKYVVCEMMNSRRAPTPRVPFLNMSFENGLTIQEVCKCRSLNDLVKVWDVTWALPMPKSTSLVGSEGNGSSGLANLESKADAEASVHNYDDRYFLDADKFRQEREDAVSAGLSSSGNDAQKEDEKKTADEDCSPAAKRTKV